VAHQSPERYDDADLQEMGHDHGPDTKFVIRCLAGQIEEGAGDLDESISKRTLSSGKDYLTFPVQYPRNKTALVTTFLVWPAVLAVCKDNIKTNAAL
jgi:hypothetical protein